MNLKQIALISEQVYGEDSKMTPSEAKLKRQEEVMAFLRGRWRSWGYRTSSR